MNKKTYIIGIVPIILVILFGVTVAQISLSDSKDISDLSKDKTIINYYEYEIQTPVFIDVCGKALYNSTTDKLNPPICHKELSYYETTIIKTDKVIGVKDDKISIDNAYIKDDKIAKWEVPIGDRNFKEYPLCRENEIRKGVCSEI